jgi:hypothetical protein
MRGILIIMRDIQKDHGKKLHETPGRILCENNIKMNLNITRGSEFDFNCLLIQSNSRLLLDKITHSRTPSLAAAFQVSQE